MPELASVFVGARDAVSLTAEQAEIERVEGELNMRFEQLRDTSGPDGSVWAGLVTIDPVTIHYTFKGHETIHVIDGEVSITVDGATIDLRAGDVASFAKGARSVWVVKSTLREFFVLTGV
ncbi:MAG: cupin domain-containing protein [Baekduia sp.]